MKASLRKRSRNFFRRLTGPLINIFNTEDPFFKIVSMIIVFGFISLVMRFVLAPSMLMFIMIPIYFVVVALLNYFLTPMIVEPQAFIYVLQR